MTTIAQIQEYQATLKRQIALTIILHEDIASRAFDELHNHLLQVDYQHNRSKDLLKRGYFRASQSYLLDALRLSTLYMQTLST